ncbi:MAG: DUF433 domain-containing protein [Burkholderiales bacterium]
MTNERIEVNPKIMLGKPVVKGTRVTVELILRKLGEGATENDLLRCLSQSDSGGYSSRDPLRSRYSGSRRNGAG